MSIVEFKNSCVLVLIVLAIFLKDTSIGTATEFKFSTLEMLADWYIKTLVDH